ncbi:Protein of unknown function [Paenibacillus sp. cl6col]|uniref:DUF3895 domain-containing protein n=1 Tax=Paenibacillus TaxID=44249 RepID=UPI0003857032|nr:MULTISPECIES: DUF3895 domain-containing protein [Paenibacillus]EPY09947.1 hypothetical protein PAAL66ix_22405 [Paenibacillus alvei A6-6i-x]SDE96475.1 Protein of unknown function [Paenibacillus sp. cl6col]
MILTIQERDEMLSQLNDNQREFLNHYLVRSRRTAFANAMAKEKGHHVPEHAAPEDIEALLDDWIYTGYKDAGTISPELRCECGRSLRYQHEVKNRKTGEIKKFGIEHLKEHLGIDAAIVATIKKGFEAIDYELDEILLKIANDWQPAPDAYSVADLPEQLQRQLSLGLPLLDKQINMLRRKPVVRNASPSPKTSEPSAAPEPAPAPAPILVEFDLWSWTEPEPAAVVQEVSNAGNGLTAAERAAVKQYVETGVGSARVISELLIRDHGTPDRRYITGKPLIYPDVCQFIEQSYLDIAVELNGTEDRKYTMR